MSKRTFSQIEDVLREMDPAPAAVTDAERHRAAVELDRILATPSVEHAGIAPDLKRRHRGRVPVAVAIAATTAVVVPTAISGGSAFASWTAIPQPLSRTAATAATKTCQSVLGVDDRSTRAAISEKRGGWTYVLVEGAAGEGACLMPEDLIGTSGDAASTKGFLGTFDVDPPAAPMPPSDGLVETESMQGSVPLRGRLPFTTTNGWLSWVSGYVGSDVVGVTVHPPVGPDVEATVTRSRFSAWWPAGEARGDNPGVGGAWTYTVTLVDGTSRPSG